MGFSPHFLEGGCGFESTSLFFGGGGIFFKILFCLGDDGGGFTLISEGIVSLRGFLKYFFLCWKCIYICLTFTQSFTQFFFVLWGSVSVGRCAFFCFWAQTCSLIIVFGQFGWP